MRVYPDLKKVMRIGRQQDKVFAQYYGSRGQDKAALLSATALILVLVFLSSCTRIAHASLDLDKWADAIFIAEGGYNAHYLYGIRSIPYNTEEEARRYCKNTVFNTLVKYRDPRCKEGESDIDCMARRYCPINSDTDNGTCKYWKGNVLSHLKGE